MMINAIYIDPKVQKLISRILDQDNGGYECNAARKVSTILKELIQGNSPRSISKITDNGEARIKNCLKYDLGKGYRLICVSSGRRFYVLFFGSHDACDTWLLRNSRLNPDTLNVSFSVRKVRPQPQQTYDLEDDQGLDDDFDDQLMASISQRHLRQLFSGIVNQK